MTPGFLALPAPRLPEHGWRGTAARSGVAIALHGIGALVLVLSLPADPGRVVQMEFPPAVARAHDLPRLVFVSPNEPTGGGGGGGGNRHEGPARRAERVRRMPAMVRGRISPVSTGIDSVPAELAEQLLEARPLAWGEVDQVGLFEGGASYSASTGTGSGGGAGTGTGTGAGPGEGSGVGPGSGGGTGGGAYRPGGLVSAPRLLSQVKPTYTPWAMKEKIQGSVWLELVVTRMGQPTEIRVIRSIDPGGLDEEALKAVRQWQFAPGRLGGNPVDVLVTVAMEFRLR